MARKMVCGFVLGETGYDESSLTVGRNTWPFISSKEALREPPLPAGNEARGLYAWRQELLIRDKTLIAITLLSHPVR